jgi:hypothetical protein
MIHYGYFVLLPNGELHPAGDSWHPSSAESYKPGDSLGVKNGTEGLVAAVVKGAGAMRNGLDVLIIVDQQRATGPRNPLPDTLVQAVVSALEAPPPRGGPPTIQAIWNGQRFVAIWNKLIVRPATETFHEFLIEVPLKQTLGEKWYLGEMVKGAEADRHIVVRWLRGFREQQAKHLPVNHKPGQVFGAPTTGEITELLALAHDLYLLQKVDRLPDGLVDRLRNHDGFQGARYEIAIAAAFVKCDFEIEWIGDLPVKHPEFVARNKQTGEEIAVETKSRRRPGVLNQPGTVPPPENLSADVDRLYREALGQDMGNHPFAIFLDVNLPPSTASSAVAGWQREIVGRWRGNEQLALLGFTNFAWHYSGTRPTLYPEFILTTPHKSARPLASPKTVEQLRATLENYGLFPLEY